MRNKKYTIYKTYSPRNKTINRYIIVFVLAVSIFITFCMFPIAYGKGLSNYPTMEDNAVLFTTRLFSNVERDQFYCFKIRRGLEGEERLLEKLIVTKRSVAIEGDLIRFTIDGYIEVYIPYEGEEVEGLIERESKQYIFKERFVCSGSGNGSNPLWSIGKEFIIPEGKYFFVGDNREQSWDSRDSFIGLIDRSEIMTKVIFFINI